MLERLASCSAKSCADVCTLGRVSDVVSRCGAGESIRALWMVHFWDYSPRGLAAFLAVYFVSAAWTSGLAIPSGAPRVQNSSSFRAYYSEACAAYIFRCCAPPGRPALSPPCLRPCSCRLGAC